MGTIVTRKNGVDYSPTNLEIQHDLKVLAKENKINITATLNSAIRAELIKIGALDE